jgi:hypothetical protein
MPENGKHDRLQQLLQDRKTSTKGRAFRPMAICLDADLSMDLEDAERELAAAKAAAAEAQEMRAGGKVTTDPEMDKRVKAAEKAVADAEALVDEASVIVTFAALKAHDYDALLKEHPPREDNDFDKLDDYNRDTFPDALMAASASKKVRDADGDLVDMEVADVIAEMSNGERAVACQVAFDVNNRQSSFSEAKSRSRQRSGSNSKRR